ncbi:MAG TPA: GPW/gp25 family protein [Thermoanaerobaculia bacterium]|nr:GPW/gp25 family protein [Thermoanaerobaculia bacterium]
MADETYSSFLGTGWSFPPEFVRAGGQVLMTSDEQDIEASLKILFGTGLEERFLVPKYGLDMREVLFEPMSTTMRTFLKDRVRTAILIHEPRINLLALEIESPDPHDGQLRIVVDYEVRSTNSRFNLVFPFYRHDSNEVRQTVGA